MEGSLEEIHVSAMVHGQCHTGPFKSTGGKSKGHLVYNCPQYYLNLLTVSSSVIGICLLYSVVAVLL